MSCLTLAATHLEYEKSLVNTITDEKELERMTLSKVLDAMLEGIKYYRTVKNETCPVCNGGLCEYIKNYYSFVSEFLPMLKKLDKAMPGYRFFYRSKLGHIIRAYEEILPELAVSTDEEIQRTALALGEVLKAKYASTAH